MELTEQFEQVRQSGACNMIDRRCVKEIAGQLEFQELEEFVENSSPEEYMEELQKIGR